MARRARRERRITAPDSDYSGPDGSVLTLRAALTVGSRTAYEQTISDPSRPQQDAWQRAFELLFERLAVRWVIADLPIDRQRDLLARLRLASPAERAWVRGVLREHCAEHFPELRAP